MLPILQRRFRALENSNAAMLQQLESIPADKRGERPSPGTWSAAELVSHIAKVESEIYRMVHQKMSEPEPVTFGDRFGSMIVRNVMRSPLRIKVPDGATMTLPDETATADKAVAAWDKARGRWAKLLEDVRAPQLKGGVFSHPRGGWFTVPQTVLFLRLHHDHHKAQFTRIAKALAAVKA